MRSIAPTPRPSERGFTLIEIGIATAIIGVVSAMGYGALETLNRKTAFSNRASQVTNNITTMQLEALQRGYPVVLMIDPGNPADTPPSPGAHALFVDRGPAFNPASFDPTNPGWVSEGEARANPTANAAKDILIEKVVWDGRFGIASSAPPSTFKFPSPYQLLPTDRACSVCSSSAPYRGYLIANPNGRWSFSGSNQEGATLVFEKKKDQEKRLVAVGVVARGGLLRVEEIR